MTDRKEISLVWSPPGRKGEETIRTDPDAGLFPAVLAAGAEKFLDRLAPPGEGKLLIFSSGDLGSLLEAACRRRGLRPVAAVGDPADPGFFDRLKVETGGRGFDTVLVASSRPAIVRAALGAAAVFCRVCFLLPPGVPVRVDLNATVNYKSLELIGLSFLRFLRELTEEEIEAGARLGYGCPFLEAETEGTGDRFRAVPR